MYDSQEILNFQHFLNEASFYSMMTFRQIDKTFALPNTVRD